MLIKLGPFGGVAPRTTARLLPGELGTIARNARLWGGSLQPYRSPLQAAVLPSPGGPVRSIYRFGQDYAGDDNYWFAWSADVDVARVPQGTGERTYFSGDGPLKATDIDLALAGGGPLPSASRAVGVPSPTRQPVATVAGVAGSGEQAVDRYYVYTFVNDWGEEGGVSPVSAVAVAAASQTITLAGLETPSGGQAFIAKRIYATAGSGADADFFYIGEVSSAAPSFTFPAGLGATPSPTGTGVGELLKTASFTPPPTDLTCLRLMPGPFLVGISGNKLRCSALGYCYAWPAIFEYPFEYDPVALGVYGNTVVVGTKGVPYIVTGFDPAELQPTKLERQYACVSKRSMCEIGDGVVYASPDGLIKVDNSGADNITQAYLNRDQWQALKPESMRVVWWDNRLVVFYDTGAERGAMLVDPGREPCFTDVWAAAAYVDPLRDALYIADGLTVRRFDAGGALTYVWRSKIFSTPRKLNFSAARIHAAGSVTVRVFADGVKRFDTVVTGSNPFRLPGGFQADEWQIELEGTSEVFAFEVAETMAELKAA
jgi:hypothetical protein